MSEELLSETLFPPAPEIAGAIVPAKKRTAAKKAATTKKAAKKKAKSEPAPEAEAETVAEPAPAKKRAAKKAAKKTAKRKDAEANVEETLAVEVAPVPVAEEPAAPIAAVAIAPVVEVAPEPVVAEVAPAAVEPVAVVAAPAAPAAEPTQASEATPASPGDAPGRRLRWWERRKLERQARAAARAAGGGGAPAPSGQSAENAGGSDSEEDRQQPAPLGPPESAEGILEISPKGHGFLRLREKGWAPLPTDVFVHGDVIRKFGLREAMYVTGEARRGSRGMQLTEVSSANGHKPDELRNLPLFEELKAVNPAKRYQLETVQSRMTTRVIDMLTPVGRGQRGLIVAPPRAGKTTILEHIAEAITNNYPNVHLMILLVDERPEEVTEFKRVLPNAEIYASSNDQDTKSHARIAELAINRAKRLVEQGTHVFMLMDSITRLARAFNNLNKGGATMSGGMGVGSMEVPRRLFAAARNTRTAGSLTILATALVETGSRMDDLIFQEFKGTGNMELVLDRKIAEQYIYPAVNIFKSGTRREELLLQGFQIEKIHFLRRGLAGHKPIEAIQRVISLMERYPSNAQMLLELSSK